MHTTPGSFIWYDLLSSDPKASIEFYEHVVGWTSRPMDNSSGYVLFVSEQGPLSGTIQMPDAFKKMGATPHWTANVQVSDIDATVAQVKELGGKVLSEPSEFPGVGRLSMIADPQGTTINLFAPQNPMPRRDVTKPGEFAWHELLASDHVSAFAFYSKIFGWRKSRDFEMGEMGPYLIYNNGGKGDLGGMFSKPKDVPRPAWMYYIQVADLDAALERAKSKSGRVINGPMPVPGGARIAQLADPQGALFALHC
ncbi:MAG TPA: VOC family protein [Polyangiaceae bacterium]|jgi:hypothetical protein